MCGAAASTSPGPGRITHGQVSRGTDAPGHAEGPGPEHPYTKETVAAFLRWPE